MKKYTTMITKDYLSHWDVVNGVREYLTNALDGSAPFEYEIGEDFVIFTSVGITLPATIFAMGYSKNRDDSSAVGQFGEGSLVGMIPLLREGKGICFINGGVTWRPSFEYNEALGIETLTINEEENNCNDENYSVVIDNLTPSEIKQIRESCTYFRTDLGETLEGTRGQVFKGISGKLFVGGIFVKDLQSHEFSYNFKPEYLQLNRDRKSVDSWDLADNTSKLLEEVFPVKELVTLVKKNSMDTGSFYAKLQSEEVAEAAYEDFKEKYGETAIVARGSDERDELQKIGYTNVQVVHNEQYRDLIKRSDSYNTFVEAIEETLEEVEVDNRTPVEMLEDFIEKHDLFGAESDLNDLIDLFKEKGVEWSQ